MHPPLPFRLVELLADPFPARCYSQERVFCNSTFPFRAIDGIGEGLCATGVCPIRQETTCAPYLPSLSFFRGAKESKAVERRKKNES